MSQDSDDLDDLTDEKLLRIDTLPLDRPPVLLALSKHVGIHIETVNPERVRWYATPKDGETFCGTYAEVSAYVRGYAIRALPLTKVAVVSHGGFAYGDPRAHAVAELRSAFADFSRNGRWGTCGGCPCDGYGRKLPELCASTDRSDHQRDIDGLSRLFKNEVEKFERAGKTS